MLSRCCANIHVAQHPAFLWRGVTRLRKSAKETLFSTLKEAAQSFEKRACGKCKFKELCKKHSIDNQL